MRWVIGDIHGMLRMLKALLGEISASDPRAQLFFVGDYVNRGPDSGAVLDLLIGLRNARFARGNHDDIFDMVVNGQCYAMHPQAADPVAAFNWFVNYGLANTMDSYHIDSMEAEWVRHHPTESAVFKLFAAVPEAHRQFIRGLEPVIEQPDVFIAHAMWGLDDPDVAPTISERLAFDMMARHRILWGRFGGDVTRRKRWRRKGYFGHTPVDAFPESLHHGRVVPINAIGAVLLDTGAALSETGRLSAVCVESGQCIQVDRSAKRLVEE